MIADHSSIHATRSNDISIPAPWKCSDTALCPAVLEGCTALWECNKFSRGAKTSCVTNLGPRLAPSQWLSAFHVLSSLGMMLPKSGL